MQSDSSSRFLMTNADLRGYLLQLNETYADSLSATDYPLPIRILLGEFLAAAALLSETIKFKGRLLLQVKGLEKITLLAAEASSERSLRCVARFQDLSDGDAPDFEALLGDGTLVVTIEPEHGEREEAGAMEPRDAIRPGKRGGLKYQGALASPTAVDKLESKLRRVKAARDLEADAV